MPRLTKRIVESAKLDTGTELFIWDSELPGFGVRVYPSGRRVYILQYRGKTGRQRRYGIGRHGPLTTEQARSIARGLLAEVHKGTDPAGAIHSARRSPTVSDLCDRYLTDHADVHKKPKSAQQDRRMIERFIRPELGNRKVLDIGRTDVDHLHQSLRATPYQANRVLSLISKMMNLAERWELRSDGSTPCRHIQKFKERKRERFLSEAELRQLATVLSDVESEQIELPSVVVAIRLLLFTGARLSEILTLQWENVDIENRRLALPDSKSGAKVIYLSPPALEILANMSRPDGNPYVITGAKRDSHLVNLEKPWLRIRARASLDDVRLHDLRHSYASVAVAQGFSLPMIGALLGHTQPATTARYAHLADNPLRSANEAIGRQIANAMYSPDQSENTISEATVSITPKV